MNYKRKNSITGKRSTRRASRKRIRTLVKKSDAFQDTIRAGRRGWGIGLVR